MRTETRDQIPWPRFSLTSSQSHDVLSF
jgi:hypothetical protein